MKATKLNCPDCGWKGFVLPLEKNPKLAEHIYSCPKCGSNWFIIKTSQKPELKNA
jgi:Zn finger protein HypA/HybF involved in hydrogenase expression